MPPKKRGPPASRGAATNRKNLYKPTQSMPPRRTTDEEDDDDDDTDTDDEPIPDPDNPPEPTSDEEKAYEYGNITRLRVCGTLVVVLLFLVLGALGTAMYFPKFYAVNEGTGVIDRTFGVYTGCRSPDNCGLYDYELDWHSGTCTVTGEDFRQRMYIVQGITTAGCLLALVAFLFSIFVLCDVARIGLLLILVALSLIACLIAGGGLLYTNLTFEEFMHCGGPFCAVVSTRPCRSGESLSFFCYLGGVVGLGIAAIITLFMRLHVLATQVKRRREREELAAEIRARREARRQRRIAQGKPPEKVKRKKKPPPEDDQVELSVVEQESHVYEAEAPRERSANPILAESFQEGNNDEEADDEANQHHHSNRQMQQYYDDGTLQWEYDERCGYYYCWEHNVFWDPASHQYYCPIDDVWSVDLPQRVAEALNSGKPGVAQPQPEVVVQQQESSSQFQEERKDRRVVIVEEEDEEPTVEQEEPYEEDETASPRLRNSSAGIYELTLLPQSGIATTEQEDRYARQPYGTSVEVEEDVDEEDGGYDDSNLSSPPPEDDAYDESYY